MKKEPQNIGKRFNVFKLYNLQIQLLSQDIKKARHTTVRAY